MTEQQLTPHPRDADNERLRRLDAEIRSWFEENDDERERRRLEFAAWLKDCGRLSEGGSEHMAAEQSFRERLLKGEGLA